MSDERFHGLAHKALGEEATPAEQRELRELIAEKPALKKQLKQMSAEVAAVRELLPLMADIEHPRRDLPPAPMKRLQREIQAVFEPGAESPGELQELLARLEAWVGGKVGAERKHLMELIFCIRQSLAAPAGGEMFADEAVLQAPLARYAAVPRRLSEATEFCASRKTDEEETRKWEAEFLPPIPPLGPGLSTAGGRELGLASPPPCSFYLAIEPEKDYLENNTETEPNTDAIG